MGEIEVHALRGVDLEIYAGEYLSIMGPSGSGKSTFFNMVGGLDKPTEGKVYIDEVDVAQLDAYELAWLRCRKIGYIFQSFNLIPVMTALENVTLPMVFAGLTSDESRDKGMELLGKVGLGERHSHKPFELSGGQQQRVAVARALANDPAVVLADEPTANLDLRTGTEIIELLRSMNESFGVTVISGDPRPQDAQRLRPRGAGQRRPGRAHSAARRSRDRDRRRRRRGDLVPGPRGTPAPPT